MTTRREMLGLPLLGVLGMLGVAGPIRGAAAASAGSAAVVISEAIRLGMYASLYVAQDRGFFAKHQLDADISSAGSIALPVPVLLSGRAQIAVTSPGMSVNAVREGARLKNVAKIVGGVSMWLMAKPNSPIRTIQDLRGKTIATLKYPSSTVQVPSYAMRVVGQFDPAAAGVKFLELPPGAQAAAVQDGRADAAAAFEWDISIGAEQFGLKPVLSFGEVLGPLCFTSAFTTEAFIQSRPEVVQGFCDAIAEAQHLMHADHTVFTEVSAKYFPKVSRQVIEAATMNFLGSGEAIPPDPTISRQDWDRAMQLELAGGSIKSTLPFEQMVDSRFALNAAKAFGGKT